MLLDFTDVNLKEIDGKEILENGQKINLGVVFAKLLYNSSEADELKIAEIARKIYEDKKIELDKSDLLKLEDFLAKANLTVAIRAPIKEAILKAKAAQ